MNDQELAALREKLEKEFTEARDAAQAADRNNNQYANAFNFGRSSGLKIALEALEMEDEK